MKVLCLGRLVVVWWLISSHETNASICTAAVCKYNFVLRRHKTMTYTALDSNGNRIIYDVKLNGGILTTASDSLQDSNSGQIVSPDDVITADGYSPRYVITINDQFPGPTIEVMQGSQVIFLL